MVLIRQAKKQDIPAVAALFVTAFPETMAHLFGDQPPHRAIRDIFSFLLAVEPDSFWVATRGEELLGYIITPQNMRRLWIRACTGGYLFKWAYRYFTGQYGFGLRPLKNLLCNKIGFILSPHNYRPGPAAQVLSLAVHPRVTGQGIGTKLLTHALQYLRRNQVQAVKLEVRPWNKPARHLYTKLGFVEVGTTSDSQGTWLVMIKSLSPGTPPPPPQ
ncbi:MAG TPA: GNAT family N-acetyltransferase [Firmicutes bacterium]|nr:GNAT family N-acetyltransferase [Bacillota bacterium]